MPNVYLVLRDEVIAVNPDSNLGTGVGLDPGDKVEYVVIPVKCNSCSTVNILLAEDFRQVETYDRQMGPEIYYTASCIGVPCDKCGTLLDVEAEFNYYAVSLFCIEVATDNCSLTVVPGLESLLEDLERARRLAYPSEEEEEDEYEDFLEAVREPEDRRPRCIILVEGKDEISILREMLIKLGLNLDAERILLTTGVGGGGYQDAIRSVRFLKKLQLEIPHLVVLDSDQAPKTKLEKLKEAGIPKEVTFILSGKEIESYLLEPRALGQILSADPNDVSKRLNEIRQKGKEKLEVLFKIYGLKPPDSDVKGLIARALSSVPAEIASLAQLIRQIVG